MENKGNYTVTSRTDDLIAAKLGGSDAHGLSAGEKLGSATFESMECHGIELVAPNHPVAKVNNAALVVLGVDVGQVERDIEGVFVPGRRVLRKAIIGVATTN
jgi:hypothetical protein